MEQSEHERRKVSNRVINLLTDNERSTWPYYRHLYTAIPLPRREPLDPMQRSSHEPDTLLPQERDTRLRFLLQSLVYEYEMWMING